MIKVMISLSLFLSLSSYSQTKEWDTHLEAINALRTSIQVAGKRDEMGKRSLILLNLFLDSDKNFSFAYSISHLTLAIERSADTKRIESVMKSQLLFQYAQDWRKWGEALRTLNRYMVQNLHFAYSFTKALAQNNISFEEFLKDEYLILESPSAKVIEFYKNTKNLFPTLLEIHLAKKTHRQLSLEKKKTNAKIFTHWEHAELLQPRLVPYFQKLPKPLKMILENVPSGNTEKPLEIFLKTRTTLNLQCFQNPKLRLHTQNFINPEDRMKQALAFYEQMELINFDPNFKCYRDPYYVTSFHKDFDLGKTAEFAKDYYDLILRDGSETRYTNWLSHQYEFIPIKEFATPPHKELQLSTKDQEELSWKKTPVQRNNHINKRYFEIANELKSCLNSNVEIGNWYNYAVWASVSGGKVLNGEKFSKLNIIERVGQTYYEALDDIPTEQEVVQMFARANFLIALEMIPLGERFLNFFCRPKASKDFEKFSIVLRENHPHEKMIRDAFRQYSLAIQEKDQKTKMERIALASTLQVMGEQMRVDGNVESVFEIRSWNNFEKAFYKKQATKKGFLLIGTEIGSLKPLKVELDKDVETETTHPFLKHLTLKEYAELFDSYQMSLTFDEQNYVENSHVESWSYLNQRLKFLAALFRTTITIPELFEAPPIISEKN